MLAMLKIFLMDFFVRKVSNWRTKLDLRLTGS